MFGGSSVDRLDQHSSSRHQHLITDSPKLVSSQERLNSSQPLTVLVDSKEISNPHVRVCVCVCLLNITFQEMWPPQFIAPKLTIRRMA